MRRFLVVALLCAVLPFRAEAQSNAASDLYDRVAAALVTGTPHVNIDPTGDATVSFTIRNIDDDPQAIRDGALSDTLTVLRAVYSAPSNVRTVTVLGTFPFQGTKSPGVRPTPMLRAVLSADRAQTIEWQNATASDVASLVDSWWLQGAFADVDTRSASPDGPLAVAIAHLDASVTALDSGSVGIGRSQFTQFFDAWDDVSDAVGQRFPTEYNAIDTDLERAEVALLHTQPVDVDTARGALSDIRATLSQIATDMR